MQACTFSNKDTISNASNRPFSFVDSITHVAIPIKIEPHRNCIYIPVVIEDSIVYDMKLDTGAPELIVDSVFVEENKEKLHIGGLLYPFPFLTPNGIRTGYTLYYTGNSMIKTQIGKNVFFHKNPIVTHAYGHSLFPVNIIGKEKIININLKEKYMALLDSLTYTADTIPFRVGESGAPIIKMPLQIITADTCFEISVDFVLDLGYGGDIVLPAAFLHKELKGLPYHDFHQITHIQDKPTTGILTYDVSVNISAFNMYLPKAEIRYSYYLEDGLIGIDFLKHFNFAIDYRKLLFHYHSDKDTITYDREASWGGLGFTKATDTINDIENLLYVGFLLKNAKADSLGINLYDNVIKVNDIEVTKRNYEALFKDSFAPTAKSLTIKKKDNSTIKIYNE
jgi:hypothetical protein